MVNRRQFLKLISAFAIFPRLGTSRVWAGWVRVSEGRNAPARFEVGLDPNDPQLRGRIAYLVAHKRGFPEGWLADFRESMADLFEGWGSWLPVIGKGF